MFWPEVIPSLPMPFRAASFASPAKSSPEASSERRLKTAKFAVLWKEKRGPIERPCSIRRAKRDKCPAPLAGRPCERPLSIIISGILYDAGGGGVFTLVESTSPLPGYLGALG